MIGIDRKKTIQEMDLNRGRKDQKTFLKTEN